MPVTNKLAMMLERNMYTSIGLRFRNVKWMIRVHGMSIVGSYRPRVSVHGGRVSSETCGESRELIAAPESDGRDSDATLATAWDPVQLAP